jgi:predicted solute-binding protein
MSKTYAHMNWCPPTFQEFRSEAIAGRVELGILDSQYTWLYENILPFKFALWSLVSSKSYETRLLQKMIEDEETFRKVHNKGIDLILRD